jgi:multisubunit Na+/H+ antiporter MnhG subunit
VSFWNHIAFSSLPPILALVIGSIAIISFSDWYTRERSARTESSVQALEALFALPDSRAARPHRAQQ